LVLAGVLAGCSGSHGFCDRHHCVSGFEEGLGRVVRCVDGYYSHSGGRSGACSHHGGVRGTTQFGASDRPSAIGP
jgi:hypothetical protein